MWAYEIFIPIAIVVGIGLVLGLVLAVAAIILHVPVDERVEAVTEVLPGANCGACGYSGCSGYASALCEGSAENGLCAPGGPEVVQKISELLGGGAVTLVHKVAMVHCNRYSGTHLSENGLQRHSIMRCGIYDVRRYTNLSVWLFGFW